MCAKIAPKTSGLVGDPPEIVAPGQDLKTATRPGKHTKNHGKSPCLMGKLWKTHYKWSFFISHVSLPEGRTLELYDPFALIHIHINCYQV